MAAFASLAVIVGLTVSLTLWREAVTQKATAVAEQARTQGLLYHANMVLLDSNQDVGLERIHELLDEAKPYPERGPEWNYWHANAQEQCRHTLTHDAGVFSAAFSPDGKIVATGSSDGVDTGEEPLQGVIHFWDLETGARLRTFEGLVGRVEHLRFTPDGAQLIAASTDIISVWDTASGQRLAQFPHHATRSTNISWLSLVPGAPTQIASCSWNSTIMIHDRLSGALIRQFTPIGGPRLGGFFAFSRDGTQLATHPGAIWDFESGKLLRDFGSIWNEIGPIVYAPSGDKIAFKGTVFDAETGAPTFAHDSAHKHTSPAFSPQGHWFATKTEDAIHLQSTASTGLRQKLFHTSGRTIRDLFYSPDGQWLLLASDDGEAKLWSREAWDNSLPGHGPPAQVLRIPTVDLSPNDRLIVTGAEDHHARIWDASSRELLLTVKEHTGTVTAAVFFPNNREVLTTSHDRLVKVWDASTGAVRLTLTEHQDELWCTQVSHDGRSFATGGRDKSAIVWDTATGEKRLTLVHQQAVSAIAFSPDDTLIATGGDDSDARIWDASTGKELALCDGHHSWVGEIQFFPDGQRLLTGSNDNTARIWDVGSGELIRTLRGHKEGIGALAISPDGKRLFTGSVDRTVRVWDLIARHPLLTLKSAYGPVHAIDLSSAGHRLIAAAHFAATLWDISPTPSLPSE